MKLSTKRFAAATLVASLALAACGGDDDEPAAEPTADEPADTTMPETTDAPAATDAPDTTEGSSTPAPTTPDAPAADDFDMSTVTGTLIGVGASSQKDAMAAWQARFPEVTDGASVEYSPDGSGSGRDAFLSGGAAFAGSDSALKPEEYEESIERCAGDSGAINLPHYISPIAVIYNLPSLESDLQLTPELIAGIFANEITNWNDPAIAEVNPDATLPDLNINPVHRSDDSGTTKNFTDYMSQSAPDVWTYGAIEPWDTDGPGGGEGGAKTEGVVSAVAAGEGSIGYADLSQIGDLKTALVEVEGEFVAPSAEAAGLIVENSERVAGNNPYDYTINVNRNPPAGTYPIALVSYHIVCLEYPDQETVDLVKAFMMYVGSDQGQSDANAGAGSAPISDAVQAELEKSVAAITVAG